MYTNNVGYNSQSNDIYSASQSGFAPTTGGNIYSQANSNLYSQNSGNVYQPQIVLPPQTGNNYVPPQTNPPVYSSQVSGGIYPGYGAQVNVNLNTNIKNTSPQVNTAPVTVSNNLEPVSTAPLIPSSNEIVVKGNCCSTDESMPQLTGCQKGCIICFSILQFIFSVDIIIMGTFVDGISHGLFISFDVLIMCFSIFASISIIRIKWLRYAATGLSIGLLGGGIILGLVLFIQASKIVVPEGQNSHHTTMEGFFVVRLVCLFIILHAFFHYYWGKIICECLFKEDPNYQSRRRNRNRYYAGDNNDDNNNDDNNNVDNNFDNNDDNNNDSSPSPSLPHHAPPHHGPPHIVPPHHGPPHHGPPHLGPPHHFI